MSAYIDIAISLILVYLVVSLVVTACNEVVATALKTRPRMLVQTIVEILGDDALVKRFYENGIIGAARGSSTAGSAKPWMPGVGGLFGRTGSGPAEEFGRGHPSYIEGRNFAKALGMAVLGWKLGDLADKAATAAAAAKGAADPALATTAAAAAKAAADEVEAADAAQKPACDAIRADPDPVAAATAAAALATAAARKASGGVPTLPDIVKAIDDLPDEMPIKDVLRSAVAGAKVELEDFEKALAAWYDTAQARLSGAYARYQKYVALAFGAALALLLNVDSVQIAERASQSRDHLAQSTAEEATRFAESQAASKCAGETDDAAATKCHVHEALDALSTIDPLLTSWSEDTLFTGTVKGEGGGDEPVARRDRFFLFIYKLFGLAVTALAVSLGAPFWFDTLSMFVNIRGAGVKPKADSGT